MPQIRILSLLLLPKLSKITAGTQVNSLQGKVILLLVEFRNICGFAKLLQVVAVHRRISTTIFCNQSGYTGVVWVTKNDALRLYMNGLEAFR